MPKRSFICFDLEGPLSPQDNAYELMKLAPNGGRAFEALSRYDDLLTIEKRPGYEPGDTLSLIVPFLVYYDVSEAKITELTERASLVDGAPELVSALRREGWNVFCISTSYSQYALHITARVGIDHNKVACTGFELDRYRSKLGREDFERVRRVEQDILEGWGDDESQMKARLDRFFWQELAGTRLGQAMAEVKPVGGQRKVEALQRFAGICGCPVKEAAALGDSITDWVMLHTVRDAGGLSIAFNANEYALPHATIGLASTHLSDLYPILEIWQSGGLGAVERAVRQREEEGTPDANRDNFQWLKDRRDVEAPLAVHKRLRRLVREEASNLG